MLPASSVPVVPAGTSLPRYLASQQWLRPLRHGVRSLQTLLNYRCFEQLRQLTARAPLAPLLAAYPRFLYKYLLPYLVAGFSRSTRLAALLHHYRFLVAVMQPDFFRQLAAVPVIWRTQRGPDEFTITLTLARQPSFEGELVLSFLVNGTLVQVVGFVVVPGHTVGVPAARALLLSQVQGSRQPALLRHATKTLHESTPATLLVQAAYGLAEALGIGHAAGISAEEQLSAFPDNHFDFNGFWQQFRGERNARNLYSLAVPAPERPIQEIKHNHRARTLRKRQFKQALREAVAAYCRQEFLRAGS